MSAIYLEQVSPLASIDLPSNIERATLIALVYMVFQSIRRTASYVAIGTVSSYLAFSPLPQQNCGGYFLLRYSALADSFPLGNMALCVARTFLPNI